MSKFLVYIIITFASIGCFFQPDLVETQNLDRSERAPSVSLIELPSNIAGGEQFTLEFGASDSNGIKSSVLEYTTDGVNWTTIAVNPESGFTWTVPEVDTTKGHLRLSVTDNMGNTSQMMNEIPFVIDSTPPTISLGPIPDPLLGGANATISWASFDLNGISNEKLEYSADGLNYITLSESTSSPFSWATPLSDTTGSKIRLSVTDTAGNLTVVESNLFNLDITPPSASIADLAAVMRGGTGQSVTFSSSDTNGIATWVLEYAEDGSVYSTLISEPVSPYNWTLPLSDTTGSKLRLSVTDNVGLVTQVETSGFNIDSSGPILTLADLGAYVMGGSTQSVSFSTSDPNGVSSVSLDYADDGTTFSSNLTITNTSPYSWTVPLTNTTGSKLQLSATDIVGNTTVVTNAPFTIDSIAPVISVTNPGLMAGGNDYTLDWVLTEDYMNSAQSFFTEYWDGSTWQSIGSLAATAGPHMNTPFSTIWTAPALDRADVKIRVTISDLAGNSTTSESSVFEIDSSGPSLSIGDLAAVIKGGITEAISFTHSDPNGVSTWSIEYAEDGLNFIVLAVDPVSPYSWSVPLTNSPGSKLRISATDNLGNVASATTSPFIIDSTAPTLNLDDLAMIIQGGSIQSLNFSMNDLNGIGSWALAFAQDGVNFTDIALNPISPYSWSSPFVDSAASKLKLTVSDIVGNTATVTNAAFAIDSTPTMPVLSPENFVSSSATNLAPLTLSASSCNDIDQIMLQESSSAPLATDPGWQSCSTSLGAHTFNPSITNQQGFRTIRAYGMDPLGNISSPQLINFIYDTQAPIMAFESIPTIPSGITYPIEWTLTEASVDGSDSFTLEFSADGGATWTLESNIPVGTSGPHTSKAYSYNWSPPVILTTMAMFRISLTDNSAQTGTAQSNTFTILQDPNAPNLMSDMMTINGSATPPATSSKYVNVSFQAIDNETNISHFCLKADSAAPNLSDPCWRAVDAPNPGLTPATTLDLINYPHLLGYVPATYNLYAWARDLKGNISSNSATVGKDLVSITYQEDNPPMLSNFFVSNTTIPPNPITDSEMVFNTSDLVYIKWTASDDKGISPSIKLYYTTDDVNYSLIASGLQNAVNNCATLNDAGTTLDDASTGCYEWISPFSSAEYFKVRLVVTDTASQDTSILSLPLNSNAFKILAGNVDPGVSSSAKSSMLTPKGILYSLAVASDGKVFFNDASNGLLYINPQTGVLEKLLAVTGTYSGDQGAVREATASNIHKITMDYEDRLLIWDGRRIRRVDTKVEPMQIETIIGGYNNGALGSETTDIVTNPADLLINDGPNAITLFHPLPNGDIYFQSAAYNSSVNNGNVLRVYRGSLASPDIQTIRIWGTGAYSTNNGIQLDLASDDLQGYYLSYDVNTSSISKVMAKMSRPVIGCSYFTMAAVDTNSYESLGLSTDSPNPHPPTFVSTCGDRYERLGLDGNMYRLGNNVAWPILVSRYNPATNDYTRVLGTGVTAEEGYCPDGTAATSCKIKASDFFVTSAGQIFMVDNGTIRVVDGAGNIQTLYGQTKVFGDGALAQDARFNSTPYIDHGVDDNVIIYDSEEKVIREIRPNQANSQMVNLAGNGETGTINFSAAASGQTLNGNSWDQPGSFVTDPISGDVFFPCVNTYICRLNRSTGFWEQWAGGGATSWLTTGTLTGAAIQMGGYNKGILASYNDKFLTGHYSWSGSAPNNSVIREFDMLSGASTFIVGKPEEDGASGCPDGIGTGCNLNANRSAARAITFHTGVGKWLYEHNDNILKFLNVSGTDGSITTFDTLSEPISSMVWNLNTLYYCTEQGELKLRDYSTMTESTLPFPNSSIKCYGYDMLFKPASSTKPDRIIFPFKQNGLSGIAEYFL